MLSTLPGGSLSKEDQPLPSLDLLFSVGVDRVDIALLPRDIIGNYIFLFPEYREEQLIEGLCSESLDVKWLFIRGKVHNSLSYGNNLMYGS